MPKKIRELESALAKAGFVRQTGKGSHRKWVHPAGVTMIMSGQSGHDARRYQERDTADKIREAQKKGNQ